ncbi:zinc finger protein 782-like [Toxorhynchites rutilus septentrionalis]|uniref:zinc finger protein 782-like n=1 Tax=Toxorhynchites rutilus septentrionalis TaxID=329112 RepID=UPI0024798C64|nr:zinc finger protein 782-like [Toxorhynchites rutilus septentrionalis]
MAFVSNNFDQCSFCSGICNEEFHHVLIPSNPKRKLKTILQKLNSSTSQLSSYPTCNKCYQELITVHNIPESCFQLLPIIKPIDHIKMEPELMIDDHDLPDKCENTFKRDSIVDSGPIEQDAELQIKRENVEVFFISEMDKGNMPLVPDAGTNTLRTKRVLRSASQKKVHTPSVHHECNEGFADEGEKPFKCKKCGKTFSLKSNLRTHIRSHKGPHSCPHCSKAFGELGILRKHLQSHSDERPYSCPQCPKAFKLAATLKEHIRTHMGKKPFKCEKCEKTFGLLCKLKLHFFTHTGERPFSCPHCPKTFSHPTTLQRHIRIHTGERPYCCPHCPNAFRDSTVLQKHIRTHTGERPYPCPHCPKAFKDSTVLRQHIRTHTGERRFSCPHCPVAYKYSKSLKQHIETHTD